MSHGKDLEEAVHTIGARALGHPSVHLRGDPLSCCRLPVHPEHLHRKRLRPLPPGQPFSWGFRQTAAPPPLARVEVRPASPLSS